MFSIRRRRLEPSTLIWDYLDGEISQSRAGVLSRLLERRPSVREMLVESAVLHGMLRQYYSKASATRSQIELAGEDQSPRRKRGRHGKSPAA